MDALKSNYVRDCVPCCIKDNVFFVVNNSSNVEKREMNLRSDYSDDCGARDSAKGTNVNCYVVFNDSGHAKSVFLKNNWYCIESRIRGKKSWLSIDPQTEINCVAKLHRYYPTLK